MWHLYVIRCKERKALQEHLEQYGVSTVIHYPIAPHHQACYQETHRNNLLPISEILAEEVLSLPMSPVLKVEEVEFVAHTIATFLD